MWREKIPTEKRETPLIFHNFFSVLEIFWNTKAFPHEIFRYCDTKDFPRKIVKLPYYA